MSKGKQIMDAMLEALRIAGAPAYEPLRNMPKLLSKVAESIDEAILEAKEEEHR